MNAQRLPAGIEEKETDNKETWADGYVDKGASGGVKQESMTETEKNEIEREREKEEANILDLSAQQLWR